MRWKIGQAKQRFSEVVRRAAVEPQLICNRERVVAAVVDPGSAERLRSIVERESEETIADAFDVFREMATRERYGLKIPPRTNRRNPFPHGVDRLSRRHERPE
jgi:antitoxin (DNA-binding transcriptional repressor) of toxin-antitoxin stability system